MAADTAVLILLAGIGAGAANAVVGAGTLITFPVLLALGVPPVVANVSNTVGLVPGSVMAAYAFRRTLVGHKDSLLRMAGASGVGGCLGGALLLLLPARTFHYVVPFLLLASALLAAVQPRVAAAVLRRRARRPAVRDASPATTHLGGWWLLGGLFATGVYGGYFGAAQGVILLALLGMFVGGRMTEVNGVKNVLAGVANVVSGIYFLAVADVNLALAGLIGIGATIGGGLGGRYGRYLPSATLRLLVVAVATVAAVWQFSRLAS